MTKNTKTVVILLVIAALIAIVPLFALKGAEFGGSDDAGSEMISEIQGKEYEPWFTPVLETALGGEPVSYTHLDVYKRQNLMSRITP